jgi:hypothetical protein
MEKRPSNDGVALSLTSCVSLTVDLALPGLVEDCFNSNMLYGRYKELFDAVRTPSSRCFDAFFRRCFMATPDLSRRCCTLAF